MAAGRRGLLPGGRLPWLVVLLSVLATAAWVVPVVVSRGHGFDISDEGSYVLSYRWWDTDLRNFTGVQYLYGPVFEALGNSVSGLRLARLASVLAAHAFFGWATMSWLRARYPEAVPSRVWALAGVLAIVAVGGVTYGWLPLSPGYNDVVALGSLLVMAVWFRCWRSVLGNGRLPVGPALALPLPVLAMVLSKWSSAAVVLLFLGLVFVVAAVALRPSGWGRFVAAGLASTAVLVGLFHVFVAPLDEVVPPLVEVNRLAAGSSHTAGALLDLYVGTARTILGRTSTLVLLLALLALVGAGMARIGMRRGARWVVAAGPVVVVVVVAVVGGSPWPVGGSAGLVDYSAGLLAIVAASAVTLGIVMLRSRGGAGRPDSARELPAVVAMLLLVPVAQAVGSGNSLASLAVNLAASWFALILVGIALSARGGRSRWFLVAAAVAVMALCVSVGADGVVRDPYRTTSYDASDRVLGGTGTLGGVAMSASDRRELDAVRRAMAPDPPGRRPVVVLDEIAGLVLLTEGRPLGEPWTSALAPDRLAAGITAACDGQKWTGARQPIVLAWRSVPRGVTDALAACGVRLDDADYREVRLPVGGRSVRIFTPTS